MIKIDLHTHILPERWPDLADRYGYGGFISLDHHAPGRARMLCDGTCFREIESNCWDPDRRQDECAAAGVTAQVLSTVPVMFSYWAQAEHAADLARLLNDHIAEIVRERPGAFLGLGTVPMQDPDLACAELERCVRALGLSGIQIGTHVNGRNLDDPAVFAVLQAAADLGAAVFVHPWDMLGADRMGKYWMRWLVGMPSEVAIAIYAVIFGGVLERLPNLRIAFAHGGGGFPGTIGRIEHGFHVRPDLCAIDNPHPPSAYLGRFFVDSLVHDAATLQHLIELVGARRIALGSDYPFVLGERQPGQLIQSIASLDAPTVAQLLGGTALEFLNVGSDRFA